MRRNRPTITYGEGDAQKIHQVLLLLKRSDCLNISALCREAITEKPKRLEHVEAAMLQELKSRQKELGYRKPYGQN